MKRLISSAAFAIKFIAFSFSLCIVTAFAKPVDIVIVDVAGNLAYTKQIWENYKTKNPDKIGKILYERSTATALPSKLMAQKKANKNEIHFVLTGYDALAAGIKNDLWLKLTPDLQTKLPTFSKVLVPAALEAQNLTSGYGVVNVYTPSGPFLTYDPKQVKVPPKNLEELKTWIKANPKKFFYARPATSGPGRTFLMALPYMLKDSNPKNPQTGWTKTWDYLKDIHKNIEYYTPGTTAQMKEFGQGDRAMTITTAGWDLQMRLLGTIPQDYKVAALQEGVLVSDAHFMVIPSTVDAERKAILLDMISFSLQPDQQVLTIETGGMYPGPAVKGVNIATAPKNILDPINKFKRKDIDSAFKNSKVQSPLSATEMLSAFEKWDREVAGQVVK